MKLNLDSLKTEIGSHLKDSGFVVFHGFSRNVDDAPEVEWDTFHYPDYKDFVQVAKELGVKLMVLHHREFSSAIIDRAIDEIPSAGIDFKDQRQVEQRLRELAMYDGFTCMIEMSFDFAETVYLFELRTEWYNELNVILEELDLQSGVESEDDGEDPLGGYYSKN
jgi:hypothetical protein